MICRHSPGDPNCSTNRPYTPPMPATPDSANYEVLEAQVVGHFMVLQVRYPNCSNCAYEGTKTMVFSGVGFQDALKWKKIDPHFRGPSRASNEAPSPIARFPGNEEGWQDAMQYANMKAQGVLL